MAAKMLYNNYKDKIAQMVRILYSTNNHYVERRSIVKEKRGYEVKSRKG